MLSAPYSATGGFFTSAIFTYRRTLNLVRKILGLGRIYATGIVLERRLKVKHRRGCKSVNFQRYLGFFPVPWNLPWVDKFLRIRSD
jgi:hypothetical protein